MTLFFRSIKPGTTSHKDSPLRSVFGIDSSGSNIVIPIDFVVFDTDGFNSQLPANVKGEDIVQLGSGAISSIPTNLNINLVPGSSISPAVKIKNEGKINFAVSFQPILKSDTLLQNESIEFVDSSVGNTFFKGTLLDTTPFLGQPFLESTSVEAFVVLQSGFGLSEKHVGSMVMIPRINKCLGMFIGFANGNALVFPAFNI
jgi:hypothetical protein